MIELVNRRFVAFYFNVGRGGRGYDADAAAFIARIDKRFSGRMVPTPPVWVFAPDGTLLTTIDNYAHKDVFFDQLLGVLRQHPVFDKDGKDEKAAFAAAKRQRRDAAVQVAAARVNEELGRYERATAGYDRVAKLDRDGAHGLAAALGLARIARYRKQWERATKALQSISTMPEALQLQAGADLAAERGHRLLAKKKYAKAYKVLTTAAKAHPRTPRMGELHFYAGVAAWFQKKKEWANFHWCWVMRNIGDDYHYMRCYLAATADAMPYRNPELGGYRGPTRMISHRLADAARDRAMLDYEKLLPEWKKDTATKTKKRGPREEDF